ncbi:MAG: HD domain-containing protein [Candidatus Latescibacteria bacterium]|nr:HD domain-containing protein [Candidatus Latescibacterota bacterium]NIO01005.1 HD domain-containing protein [Candidatus Latescibacterota bacterium]NIO27404.1 HD domain-containing protein [Candidatus Latescibacterota bacterium]NIO54926.1 HD domain-containing protein [Candidatus Latescibacterota bacterium]NIT01015.1 HD domain-containing protein [Candidatus Latescibacterota bacterium]
MTDEFKRSSLSFKIFYFSFILCGLFLFAYLMKEFPIERYRDVVLFITLIIVADTAQIALPRGGAYIYPSSPIDLAGIMLFGPAAIAFIEAVATLFSEVFIQKRPAMKIAFNVPLLVMTVGLSGIVYWSFGDPWTGLESPRFLLPLFICGVSYYVINTFSISTVIGLSDRKSPLMIWKQNYMWTFFHIFAFLPVGAIIALIYLKAGMWTLALFVIPLFLARYSFQLYIDMKEAHINTVAALTSAIDANDPFTHGHSYRVSRYALRIGRAMGLSSKDLEILEYGALLHDIGKIAIQHDILLKVGKLTEEDRRTLEQHPSIGADIVENLKFLKGAAVLVRYHHEQPDGKGYPEGLKGEEIPVGARILLVADAFDAMTSDRPYRKGLSLDQVADQFEQYKDIQFDAEIVDLFCGLVTAGEFSVIVESDPTTAIYESLKERL